MGHQLVGRNSVPLEGWGGLITIANPSDLPENASPRNWDVDFTIGGASQRDGLYAALIAPTPGLSNFLYAKTFLQPNGQINTLVMAQNGLIFTENVNTTPGLLTEAFSFIPPGSYMFSVSNSNREYMCFSDISDPTQQGDVPRQWAGPGPNVNNFDRISQCAPGAPPSFNASLSAGTAATITSWAIVSNIVTFQAINSFVAGEIVTINGLVTGSFMNNMTFTVSGTGLTGTAFEVGFTHANASATENGTATPQYSYPLASITQPQQMGNIADQLWSAGPGSTSPGNVMTFYFQDGPLLSQTGDPILQNAVQNNPEGAIVYITGAQYVTNGAYQVTSYGGPTEAPGAGYERFWFTISMPSSQYQQAHGHPGGGFWPMTYQLTVATVTAAQPIPNLNIGDQVQFTGVTPGGWDSVWAITQSLTGYTLEINATSMTGSVGKYYYSYVSGGTNGNPPANGALVGQLITVTGTLNGGGIFNVTDATIASNNQDGGGSYFTINGFTISAVPSEIEIGASATTSGTLFQIDPGIKALNTNQDPIYGNTTGGFATIVGGNSAQFPLAAGTRQAVVLFVTRNGAITPASLPSTFNTVAESNFIFATQVPIGPPDVIARIIAFTEAGQNGIAGESFYYIPIPVKTVLNNVTTYYSATVIQDNITTNAKFTFNDETLLDATEIDIPGSDYFNTVEIGNSAWNISYGDRMFYGLVQNKVYNFVNMSFDGGYIATGNSNPLPAGWGIDVGSNPNAGNASVITAWQITTNVALFQAANNFIAGQQVEIDGLVTGTQFNGSYYTVLAANLSTTQFAIAFTSANVGVTADSGTATPQNTSITLTNPAAYAYGNAYYSKNTTGSKQSVFGMITQTAYQDYYQVNILNPQVTYGVRVRARCPSGVQTGNLVIDLTTNNTATYGYSGYNVTYGITYEAFTVQYSAMSSTKFQTFEGTLLSSPFQTQVPTTLLLRMWQQNIPNGGDCEVKSIEIFPLTQPIGFPDDAVSVIGSYIGLPETFDLVSGPLSLSQGNQQQVYGAAVFNGILFFLKESSIVSTSQTPGQEPGEWATEPVTDQIGACGIYAYDVGKEYVVTACRAGIFGFNGGEPQPGSWEIRDLWNTINWAAARTIWVKNDVVQHKIYVGVPLPTPNQWLPNAPYNPAPTSPNVVLVCNYLGLETFQEIFGSAGMHVTMFGTLADLDMRRKWTVWNIAAPNAAFLVRPDIIDKPIFFCNGINSGKVYGLSATQLTDDGAWINWDYCTYGFVNPAKAKENPLLGFHRKRYTSCQLTAAGSGPININLLADDIVSPVSKFNIWRQPNLTSAFLDYKRNLNMVGNRVFVEFSSGGIGTTANISRMIMVGNADLHAPHPSIPGR